jgi:YD repeat-containing protein
MQNKLPVFMRLGFCVLGIVLTAPFTAQQAFADTYTYDAKGRLSSVTLSSNGVVTYYCYDAAGNRTYVGPTPC